MSATTAETAGPSWTFDGVVRLTRIGTAYLVFTLILGFAAINTGNNALYIGLTFMLGALLLSGVASKGGLKNLRVEPQAIDQPWAGRAIGGMLRITNISRIWNVRDVVITSDELLAPMVVPLVARQSHVDVPADFLFGRRGIAELNSVDLYTRYPFGFFLKKRRTKMTGQVVVFPRLLSRDEGRDRFRPILGEEHSANRPGPGSEVHSFREYVRGDSWRHVNWKKTASIGRWIIKQTEVDTARAVHVVFDPFRPKGASEEDFEMMVSAAATYIFYAIQRGLSVVVSMPRMTLHAGEGRRDDSVFHALAVIEPVFEPVHQAVDRDTVLFTLRRSDERASA